MSATSQNESDFQSVTFVVASARQISSKHIFALVDVEMRIAEISFWILGVQARRLPTGGTVVCLPNYRDTNGRWQPAIKLPEELQEPLFQAVMDFLVDERLARRREFVSLQS